MMRMGWVFSLCIALFGCTKNVDEQTSRYHDDGRAKPVVSVIPVFDQSEAKIAWSLSEEFTNQLRQRLFKRNRFYLSTPEEINTVTSKLTEEENPFSTDYGWVKEAFDGHEFIVFTELVEHDIHPKPLKNNFLDKLTPYCELSMTMRVRIFDLRSPKPQIILQELIHQSHLIPKPSNLMEASPDRWKKMTFNVSPMGLAHSQLSKEVSKRIEDYILLSQTH